MDDITNSLCEMNAFIIRKNKELSKELVEGDYDHLVAMIRTLNEIREKTSRFDFIYEPIRMKMELLKHYGQTCSNEVLDMLQVLYLKLLNNI